MASGSYPSGSNYVHYRDSKLPFRPTSLRAADISDSNAEMSGLFFCAILWAETRRRHDTWTGVQQVTGEAKGSLQKRGESSAPLVPLAPLAAARHGARAGCGTSGTGGAPGEWNDWSGWHEWNEWNGWSEWNKQNRPISDTQRRHSRKVLVANVSPSQLCLSETLSTRLGPE